MIELDDFDADRSPAVLELLAEIERHPVDKFPQTHAALTDALYEVQKPLRRIAPLVEIARAAQYRAQRLAILRGARVRFDDPEYRALDALFVRADQDFDALVRTHLLPAEASHVEHK